MVYTSILIHSARMKTKGKELVKIIDICDSCAHEIFPVAVNINICRNNTVETLVRLDKKYKVVYQSKAIQLIVNKRVLTKEVQWF